MRSGGVAVSVVALLAVGACSGDDETAASTTAAPPPTSVAETTAEPSTTDVTTSIEATTTSAAPDTTTSTVETTIAPTSSAPDTTLDPDDLAANTLAIIETVERSFEIYNAALNDPFDDEKVAALSEVFTPRMLRLWMNIIDEYRENDFRSLPNPERPAQYDVDINSVEVNLNSGEGSVQACHLNTFIKIQVGGDDDGSDLIVDEEITEQVEQLELIREDGVWRVHRASLPDPANVTTPCG